MSGGEGTGAAPPTTRHLDDDAGAPREEAPRRWPLVGERYALRGPIGRGGMATVFEAVDLATGDVVALKRPRISADDPHVAATFLAEARAVVRVAHPNIVRVLDAGIDPQGPWLAMERLRGESLHDKVAREGRLTPEEVSATVLPLLAGVDAVHDAGLAHGDIKPSNVILARRGGLVVPMLIDFGVATRAEPGAHTEELLGTPMFMAPERFIHRTAPDVPSDVWSLGALLYMCLSGAVPFHGRRVADVVYEVLTHRPAEVPGMSDALRAVVDRAMRQEPEARYPSARAMAAALRAALAD